MTRLVILAFASCAACATYASTARDEFVRAATCPSDRVTIAPAAPAPAPAVIAIDPGRLAVWNAQARRNADSVLVARGCGQEIRYSCVTLSAGEGRHQTNYPDCTPENARFSVVILR